VGSHRGQHRPHAGEAAAVAATSRAFSWSGCPSTTN
jgi:hypothetical protein